MNQIEYHLLIKDLPSIERPRERLSNNGASSLSNSELLAIILRTGSSSSSALDLASKLLARFGNLGGLNKATFSELCKEHGIGEAKTSQIKAAFELGRRLHISQPEQRLVVKSPQDIADLLLSEMSFFDQEHLRVVLLNTKNQVMRIPEIYKGNVNTSQIRISEVFREAIRENSPAIIVVHNHPSGDPTPSKEDINITEQVVKAGELLNIEVLDHIIVGQQKYVSLKEQGLGFK